MENLAIIIPVYNEEEIVENVINKLSFELQKLNINYKIFAYNDGSKDNSKIILEKLAKENDNLVIINKPNSGHGHTILKGYKENVSHFTWLFQIDADNEMGSEHFKDIWEKRKDYDFLIGIRDGRVQVLSRKLVSSFSRLITKLFWGNGPWDVNCPYRLLRAEKFINLFNQLPENTFSPNLIISGYVAKKNLKVYEQKIPCRERQTGVVSLQKMKLLKTAFVSLWQTIIFSFIVK